MPMPEEVNQIPNMGVCKKGGPKIDPPKVELLGGSVIYTIGVCPWTSPSPQTSYSGSFGL